jgi:hypothetical protein
MLKLMAVLAAMALVIGMAMVVGVEGMAVLSPW